MSIRCTMSVLVGARATKVNTIRARKFESYLPPAASSSLAEIIGPIIAAGISEKLAILKLVAKYFAPKALLTYADVISVLSCTNFSPVIVLAIVIPSSMVTRFASSFCAVCDKLLSTPHSRIRLQIGRAHV